MPTTREVASELRRLADSFDKEPETRLDRPFFSFRSEDKDRFFALARLFPRPLEKKFTEGTYPEVEIFYKNDAIWVYARIARDKVCKVVKAAQPAEFECEALLSEKEFEEVGQ